MDTKICNCCNVEKDTSEFKPKGLKCNSCRKQTIKEYRRIYHKKYREENREKLIDYHKKYEEENKERLSEKRKKYREENKERLSENSKKYKEENKERLKCHYKKYREENREKLRDYYKKYVKENKEKNKEIFLERLRIRRKKYNDSHKDKLKQSREENKDKKREYDKIYSKEYHKLHPLMSKWYGIKRRCYNVKCKKYKSYGGRGIVMCDEWKDSFIPFEKWALKNGWKPGYHCHRIDNDGPYSPENVKFLSPEDHKKEHKGETDGLHTTGRNS